jgi:hypothetical protein
MSSAGLRRGAIPSLKFGDLLKIEKYNVYKITVYKKESEVYTTFCSPECATYLDEYFEWRKRLGEILTAKSPVIRKEFDTVSPMKISRARPIRANSISTLVSEKLD